jgi:hypothetical protein
MKMLGWVHGALRLDAESYQPLGGDCAFIFAPPVHQHIYTCISFDTADNRLVSVDGGQIPPQGDAAGKWVRGDGSCLTIRKILRFVKGLGSAHITYDFDYSPRELKWWVDVSKLQFEGNVITPVRGNDPELPDWEPSYVSGTFPPKKK